MQFCSNLERNSLGFVRKLVFTLELAYLFYFTKAKTKSKTKAISLRLPFKKGDRFCRASRL